MEIRLPGTVEQKVFLLLNSTYACRSPQNESLFWGYDCRCFAGKFYQETSWYSATFPVFSASKPVAPTLCMRVQGAETAYRLQVYWLQRKVPRAIITQTIHVACSRDLKRHPCIAKMEMHVLNWTIIFNQPNYSKFKIYLVHVHVHAFFMSQTNSRAKDAGTRR